METKGKSLNDSKENRRFSDPSGKRAWHAPEMHRNAIRETTKGGVGLADDGATMASTV